MVCARPAHGEGGLFSRGLIPLGMSLRFDVSVASSQVLLVLSLFKTNQGIVESDHIHRTRTHTHTHAHAFTHTCCPVNDCFIPVSFSRTALVTVQKPEGREFVMFKSYDAFSKGVNQRVKVCE